MSEKEEEINTYIFHYTFYSLHSQTHFFASATVKNDAGGILYSGLSVGECVSLCVPETL